MTKPSPELAALFDPVLAWLDGSAAEPQPQFDMLHFHHEHCGTHCCIVGALALFRPDLVNDTADTLMQHAIWTRQALIEDYGMTEKDSEALFLSWDPDHRHDPAHAAKRVRHWIETGEVLS